MKELIFASGNKGKISEVKKIMAPEFDIISMYDIGEVPEIIEDGDTFEANAFIKAESVYKMYNKPVIADDSGLSVEQLNGRPGVFSARYAGENCTYEDNNKKLLIELSNLSEPHRAMFICFAVYFDGLNRYSAEGNLTGRIIKEFRGKNGFGYDPVFVPNGYQTTLAEMNPDKKNSLSHRAIAFRELKKILQTKLRS